jgi:hypothetical protein
VPRDENTYPTIPINSAHHTLTHRRQRVSEHTQIDKYIMSQYADLAQVMKDTPMGGTNVSTRRSSTVSASVANLTCHLHEGLPHHLDGARGRKIARQSARPIVGRKVTELMLTMQQVMGIERETRSATGIKTNKTMPEIMG